MQILGVCDRPVFTKMYKSYIMELGQYMDRPASKPPTKADIGKMLADPSIVCLCIYNDEDQPIGFCILGINGNCHPDADYYIAEYYIRPDFRKLGYGRRAIAAIMRRNPGRYAYHILKKNVGAKVFWSKVIDKLGCEDVTSECEREDYLFDCDFYVVETQKEF